MSRLRCAFFCQPAARPTPRGPSACPSAARKASRTLSFQKPPSTPKRDAGGWQSLPQEKMRAGGFRFGSAIARTIAWSGKAFRSSEARPLRPPPPAGAGNGSHASDEGSVRRLPGFSCVRTRRFHSLTGQWRNEAVVRAPGFEVELGPPRRQPLLPVADHRADLVAEFLAEVLRAGPQVQFFRDGPAFGGRPYRTRKPFGSGFWRRGHRFRWCAVPRVLAGSVRSTIRATPSSGSSYASSQNWMRVVSCSRTSTHLGTCKRSVVGVATLRPCLQAGASTRHP